MQQESESRRSPEVAKIGETWFIRDNLDKKITVGRGAQSDVSLETDLHNISREHLVLNPFINPKTGEVFFQAFDTSSNGTFVLNENTLEPDRLKENIPRVITEGTILQLGSGKENIRLKFDRDNGGWKVSIVDEAAEEWPDEEIPTEESLLSTVRQIGEKIKTVFRGMFSGTNTAASDEVAYSPIEGREFITQDQIQSKSEKKRPKGTPEQRAHIEARENEDQVVIHIGSNFALVGVEDGAGGDKNSLAVVKIVAQNLENIAKNDLEGKVLSSYLIKTALKKALDDSREQIKNMPGTTTATISVVFDNPVTKQKEVAYVHAGDSVLYQVKRDGQVEKVTEEQTMLWMLQQSQPNEARALQYLINSTPRREDFFNLTEDAVIEALQEEGLQCDFNYVFSTKNKWYRDRNLLGNGINNQINGSLDEYGSFVVENDDFGILAVSDGISDVISENGLSGIFRKFISEDEDIDFAAKIVEFAVNRGEDNNTKNDDATAVFVKF